MNRDAIARIPSIAKIARRSRSPIRRPQRRQNVNVKADAERFCRSQVDEQLVVIAAILERQFKRRIVAVNKRTRSLNDGTRSRAAVQALITPLPRVQKRVRLRIKVASLRLQSLAAPTHADTALFHPTPAINGNRKRNLLDGSRAFAVAAAASRCAFPLAGNLKATHQTLMIA